ncbi:GDSL esterase/lipase [Vitis vinifera]|uniref:GDSL esterase/lipase n=1 Tax=Vitis vinifera TaxID=29760 RepID=A0A438IY00_VITVI|nr:GDSL esterase/lipase [Vitis vinifera]
MKMNEKGVGSIWPAVIFVVAVSLCFASNVEGGRSRSPVIFNMGDSNSDTGSVLNGFGFVRPPPFGRLFHRYVGRVSDGRLIIDFLCENLTTSYLTPYLKSMGSSFTNGANFAVGGGKTFPRFDFFNLGLQSVQFFWFQNQSIELTSKGYKDFVKEEDFKRALYMVDIGQNDLALAFGNSSYAQVVERIPTFIAEIEYAIVSLYQHGGRKFWVHNTGPLGCLPQQLVNISRSSDDFDNHGCLKSRNNAAKKFNKQLKALCKKLRAAMKDATIVYVDIFAIKYDLIANAKLYGFENPLMVCCGHGGPPYNFDNLIQCGGVGFSVCEEGSKYVSWDGIHYTQLANQFVASKILSTNFSTPPLHFDFFCD